MKIEFYDLLLLSSIEQCGSFAKAAEKMFRTRSAISQNIQKLEDDLGYKIFDRSKHPLQFTPEGRFLLEKARHILRQMDQLNKDMSVIESGYEAEFSIAYDDILSCEGMLSLIKDFQSAISPSISIRLHREVMNGVWDALAHNRAPLAIGVTNDPPPDLPCHQKNLGITEFIFAISPHHPLAKLKTPLTREDIGNACSIVISDTSLQLPKWSGGTLSDQTIIRVPTMNDKIRAQVLGLGVGYLPRHRIENYLKKGILVERNSPLPRSKTHLKIAWRSDTESKILDWFLKHLENNKVIQTLLMPDPT